jgi:cholesterol oxidase
MARYDAIVIGSGFGGAVMTCRLAEAGYKVLVLERGRRWGSGTPDQEFTDFPRDVNDPWVWADHRPEKFNGWVDFRVFPNMTVVQGAGVGGGSLIYANISTEAPPQAFETGWPKEIRYADLRQHYAVVGEMLGVRKLPEKQWNPRTRLMRDAAEAVGENDRFKMLDLAVTFDDARTFDELDALVPEEVEKKQNKYGRLQGYCIHRGECDIGCPVLAKNTLDLNYLARAEATKNAEIRPLHLATGIRPIKEGYEVHFDHLRDGHRFPGIERSRLVVLAAGSLGSTELLLKCRDVLGTLPKVSSLLGHNWSSNGDFLTPAFHKGRQVLPNVGLTITSAIDFLDASRDGQSFWIQDGGFPHLLGNFLGDKITRPFQAFRAKAVVATVQAMLRTFEPYQNIMPWFAQGVDAADGTLRLKRPWWFFGERRLHLDWDVRRSLPVFRAIEKMHKNLAEATGGIPFKMPGWSWSDDLITPHPLGGCGMGDSSVNGVVSHAGEVFGYKNLFVVDGAIFPRAIGVNPSRTIAALSERIAAMIASAGR